ncbi:hypothetical protein [Marinicella sp. W31]|uniref:hypothetical protein n=1 Tax=Marinicella sp. W31 TaxID=3023713 RepID=UPI003757A96A
MKSIAALFFIVISQCSSAYLIVDQEINGVLAQSSIALEGKIVGKSRQYHDRNINEASAFLYTLEVESVLLGSYHPKQIDFILYTGVRGESKVNVPMGKNIVVFIDKDIVDSTNTVSLPVAHLVLREVNIEGAQRLISLDNYNWGPKKENSIPKHLLISEISRFKKGYPSYWFPVTSY